MKKLLFAVALVASLSACGGGDAHTYIYDEERDTTPPVDIVETKPLEEAPPAPTPPADPAPEAPTPLPKPDVIFKPDPKPDHDHDHDHDRGHSCDHKGKGKPPHC